MPVAGVRRRRGLGAGANDRLSSPTALVESLEMNPMSTDSAYIWSYGDHFLVVCPRCEAKAEVLTTLADGPRVRLSCLSCGHHHPWERRDHGVLFTGNRDHFSEGQVVIGAAVDWYFHLPLWLATDCGGNVLWAYNVSHLSWLKSYIAATHRARRQNAHGWSNQALASRLPKWLKAAKSRARVLNGIERLERRLS